MHEHGSITALAGVRSQCARGAAWTCPEQPIQIREHAFDAVSLGERARAFVSGISCHSMATFYSELSHTSDMSPNRLLCETFSAQMSPRIVRDQAGHEGRGDRKSTRLNS